MLARVASLTTSCAVLKTSQSSSKRTTRSTKAGRSTTMEASSISRNPSCTRKLRKRLNTKLETSRSSAMLLARRARERRPPLKASMRHA